MSDNNESITPVAASVPAVTAPARLLQLGAKDLARLLLGVQFAFWSLLVLLATLAESLVSIGMRSFTVLLILGSAGGLLAGAWQLHHVNGLGESWRKRCRDLRVGTALILYLAVFYILWRKLPVNLYFLGHTLAFGGVLIAVLCLLCLLVAELAQQANRRNLAIQCIAFGTVAAVLLFPPFGLVAQALVAACRDGRDPMAVAMYWMERAPWVVSLLVLLPFSLTLSLLWSAKDLVWEYLN